MWSTNREQDKSLLPEQALTDYVPRGISSQNEEQMTEKKPWVPEDEQLHVYYDHLSIA